MCAYLDMIGSASKSGNGQDVECYIKEMLELGDACECLPKYDFGKPKVVYGAAGKLGAVINGELPTEKGEKGEKGESGDSAYETALLNGFCWNRTRVVSFYERRKRASREQMEKMVLMG